eukprot:g8828.t1 g8828   contig34:203168-204442(+)
MVNWMTRHLCCLRRRTSLTTPSSTRLHHGLDDGRHQSWTVDEVARWVDAKLHEANLQPQNNQHVQYQHRYRFEGSIDDEAVHSSSNLNFCCNGVSMMNCDGCDYTCNNKYSAQEEDTHYHEQAIQHTKQAIIDHRIDGASLEHLTIPNMVQLVGIPFGLAVQLKMHLDDLFASTGGAGGGGALNGMRRVGELPSWYESDMHNLTYFDVHAASGISRGKVNDEQMNTEDDEYNNTMPEHAQKIMQDRFGITLPTLRSQDDSQHGGFASEEGSAPQYVSSNHTATVHEVDGSTDTDSVQVQQNNLNMEELLKSMPPQVRAVAARRSDLVLKLLSKKQQPTQQLHLDTTTHSSLEPIAKMELPLTASTGMETTSLSSMVMERSGNVYLESVATQKHCAEDDAGTEEEFNIDSESVGLLRRRNQSIHQ